MYLLVQANDVKEAYENTLTTMKDTMGEFTIPAVSESPIVDVFPYFILRNKSYLFFSSRKRNQK